MAVQVLPFPEYPVLHAQVLAPGPVPAHVAWTSQPPLLVAHESMAVHFVPSPL
jgi:hypothetical protein